MQKKTLVLYRVISLTKKNIIRKIDFAICGLGWRIFF